MFLDFTVKNKYILKTSDLTIFYHDCKHEQRTRTLNVRCNSQLMPECLLFWSECRKVCMHVETRANLQ